MTLEMSRIVARNRRAAGGVRGTRFDWQVPAILAAALSVLAGAPAEAQSCGLGGIRAFVDVDSQRVMSFDGGFCDNNITGSEDCGGDVGKIEFELALEDAGDVDLTCTSSQGVVCIMANDCQGDTLGERLSDQRVRLRGAAPETTLKILVADDAIRGTLCNNSADITITCAGSFGGTRIFQSDFEGTFEEEGWDTGGCGGCNLFAGTLPAHQSAFTHSDGVWLSGGDFHARLEGSAGAELDLYLWRRAGSGWRVVASSGGPGSPEEIRAGLRAGFYRWEIRAGEVGGAYSLRLAGPDLGEIDP